MAERFDGSMYAVAVRDEKGLWLLCRIRRSEAGDVFYLIPRDSPGWNPHASYHKSGQRHLKSHGRKHLVSQSQKPDQSFRGIETIFAMAIQPGEAALPKSPCIPGEYSDVFEIPRELIALSEHHTLVADLVEPGKEAAPGPWKEIVTQKTFRDAVPWILVTLWRGLTL